MSLKQNKHFYLSWPLLHVNVTNKNSSDFNYLKQCYGYTKIFKPKLEGRTWCLLTVRENGYNLKNEPRNGHRENSAVS